MFIFFFLTSYVGSAPISSKTSLKNYSSSFNHLGLPSWNFKLRREYNDSKSIAKRYVEVKETLKKIDFSYFIDFELGSPPQSIEAEVDFKYRGTYILTQPMEAYLDREGEMSTFFPSVSGTYIRKSRNFGTTSHNFGSVSSNWAEEELRFGNSILKDFKFLCLTASSGSPVIGLGFPGTSAFITKDPNIEDSTNILEQVRRQGWVSKAAYSFWIGSDISKASGFLLFSKVDYRYRLSGNYVFPLLNIEKKKGVFIKIDGINVYKPNGRVKKIVEMSMPIELDITIEESRLPAQILESIYENIGVSGSHPMMPCELVTNGSGIGFIFSGVQFVFPYFGIIADAQRGYDICSPPFLPSESPVLGANILSMLYIVFDLDSKEIGLAIARTDRGVENEPPTVVPIWDSIIGTRAPYYSSTSYYNDFTMIVGTGDFRGSHMYMTSTEITVLPTTVPTEKTH